jgi:uncharacterized oxidoreductase
MTVHIFADELTNVCARVFERVGCSPQEARAVAASLVDSNLAGHDSHGVIRVPRYAGWVQEGELTPNQTPVALADAPGFAVIDGSFGFGQIMAPHAVDVGVEKARGAGVAAVSLRHSGHLGRVGEWAERAAAAGMASIHFVNAAGSVLVAPFGGLERRLSTAPFCVGLPREGAPPVILDFATSLVAEGKVRVAAQGGKALPADALIGPDGRLSGDPAVLYGPSASQRAPDYNFGEGAIRAFGEHKGSGLALICELLGGSLTGNGATALEQRFSNGMFSIFVNPRKLDPSLVFDADMTRYLDWFSATRPIPGQEILLPGEPERRARAQRSASGVPLPEEVWEAIQATARDVGATIG